MYAASKKDINRNKSFHAMSGANIARRERLRGEKRDRDEDVEKERAQLERERREARLDEQFDLAQGLEAGHTSLQKRTAWLLEESGGAGEGAASSSALAGGDSATAASASAAPVQAVMTGTITQEEAEAARKRISDEKKRRMDPLARADCDIDAAVLARLVGAAAFGGTSVAPRTGSMGGANQARLQGLLARARK